MTTISGILETLSAVAEIGSYHVTEIRLGWKDALLSGNKGNDLVDLYLCHNQKNNPILIGVGKFIESEANTTISDMVDANLVSLGYPMVYIEEALGIKDIPIEISYSLLYRSASVILEAERLNVRNAILVLVGSNSDTTENKAFHSFATLLCDESEKNLLHKCALKSRVNFYFGLFDSTSN